MNNPVLRKIGLAKTHVGAKVAVLCGNRLVTYLRDNFAHIHDPGLWDFPGGERHLDETAIGCAIRETEEEFGIVIEEDYLTFASDYKSHQPGRANVAFFVAIVSEDVIQRISFGDEGQYWRMMEIEEFLARRDTVRELRGALLGYLDRPPWV